MLSTKFFSKLFRLLFVSSWPFPQSPSMAAAYKAQSRTNPVPWLREPL